MESEYWNSERMDFDCVTGADIEDFSQYGTSKDLNEEGNGYPVLRLNEFDSLFIGKPAKYCNLIDYETFKSLQLKKDDVLICRTNGNPKYVGKAALVPMDYDYAFASYLFRIRPKADVINPATLVVFLNSRYGRAEIEKYSMVGNQANFSPAKFREINIPILTKDFQQEIASMVQQAHAKLEESKSLYGQAQALLESELKINIESDKTPNVNIKPLSQSFFASGRLDAEHYQEKYDRVENAIKGYKGGWRTIADILTIEDGNFVLEDKVEYNYIELANIGKSGEIDGMTIDFGEKLPTRARRVVKTGDVLVSSIEGSLQSCALVTEPFNQALCSTGFYVVHSGLINPETLLVLMKSAPIQALLKKGCSGTILTAIGKPEFNSVVLPIVPQIIQHQISALVQKSFALKAESKQLLESAKTMVEKEIEK